MRFCRWLLLLCLLSLLQACCVTPRVTAEYQWGKINFTSGNYKCAFRQLLPVAADGCPDAQYAIGYMYYYGYGVAQDDESGLFWMKKSAEKHYCPAVKALYLLSQEQSGCPELDRSYKQQDEVAQSLAREACEPCYAPPPCAMNKTGMYTLQFFGSYELLDVKDFQAEYCLQRKSRIWHTYHNDRDWYVLTYGRFATAAEARCAQENLPCRLKSAGSWIRKVCGLQPV